jgi:RNA polymerase sigma-70 factor, ECF subfamily
MSPSQTAPANDGLLIERLRHGEDGAVAELVIAYRPRILHMAVRYLKNREDAEEVAQDVLVKVCHKIAHFRGDAALSSWIYRIAFNTVMSRLRSARLFRPSSSLSANDAQSLAGRPFRRDIVDRADLADERVLRRQLRAELARAMQELPPIYRVPVILRDVRGLSTEQASRHLSLKDETLKSRLHRGRLMLRRRLAHLADGLTMQA